jgi:hypothetical protein
MRVKKSKTSRAKKPARASRAKKSPGASASSGASTSSHAAWDARTRAIVLGIFCMIVAVALLSAREETPHPRAGRADIPITAAALGMDTPGRTETMKPSVAKASPVVAKDDRAAVAPSAAADSRPTMADSRPTMDEGRLPIEDAASPPQAQPDTVAAVTVSGCLENDEGVFRLTDVSGSDIPTGRSWKSGFLRKRPASIEVADAVGTLTLRSFVGRRVSTSGTLIEREMHARTVRVVGACD